MHSKCWKTLTSKIENRLEVNVNMELKAVELFICKTGVYATNVRNSTVFLLPLISTELRHFQSLYSHI